MEKIKGVETYYTKAYGFLKQIISYLQDNPNNILSLNECIYIFIIKNNSEFESIIKDEDYYNNKDFYKKIMMLIIVSKAYQYIIYKIEHETDIGNNKHKMYLFNKLTPSSIPAMFNCPNLGILVLINDFINYSFSNYITKSLCKSYITDNSNYKNRLITINPFEILDISDIKPKEDLIKKELMIDDFISTYTEIKMIAEQEMFVNDSEQATVLKLFNFDLLLRFNFYEKSKIKKLGKSCEAKGDREAQNNYILYICSIVYEALSDHSVYNNLTKQYEDLPYKVKKILTQKNKEDILELFRTNDEFAYAILELCYMANLNIKQNDLDNRTEFVYKDKNNIKVMGKLDPYYETGTIRKRNN